MLLSGLEPPAADNSGEKAAILRGGDGGRWERTGDREWRTGIKSTGSAGFLAILDGSARFLKYI